MIQKMMCLAKYLARQRPTCNFTTIHYAHEAYDISSAGALLPSRLLCPLHTSFYSQRCFLVCSQVGAALCQMCLSSLMGSQAVCYSAYLVCTQETDRVMEDMFDVIAAHTPVGWLELVMNHSSFSQTVENIFTLSFLVRISHMQPQPVHSCH